MIEKHRSLQEVSSPHQGGGLKPNMGGLFSVKSHTHTKSCKCQRKHTTECFLLNVWFQHFQISSSILLFSLQIWLQREFCPLNSNKLSYFNSTFICMLPIHNRSSHLIKLLLPVQRKRKIWNKITAACEEMWGIKWPVKPLFGF